MEANLGEKVFHKTNLILMIFMLIVTAFPLYYVLIISFADYRDINTQEIFLYPKVISFAAYRMIFQESFLLNSFMVSVFVTVVGCIISLTVTIMAAYALSKKNLPGRKLFLSMIIFTMFFSGGLIPYYFIVKAVGLKNSIFSMIIPVAINSFYLILVKNFFESVPSSLEESAKIDGANDILILIRIVIPISAPVIATFALFYAAERWNEWFNAMLFISQKKQYPLQLILRQVLFNFDDIRSNSMLQQLNRGKVYSKSVQMAVVILAAIPIVAVYPYLQKHFTKGILVGAIKG